MKKIGSGHGLGHGLDALRDHYGSKTEEGSYAIALLASVTETLCLQKCNLWTFFTQLFRERRGGQVPQPLPASA